MSKVWSRLFNHTTLNLAKDKSAYTPLIFFGKRCTAYTILHGMLREPLPCDMPIYLTPISSQRLPSITPPAPTYCFIFMPARKYYLSGTQPLLYGKQPPFLSNYLFFMVINHHIRSSPLNTPPGQDREHIPSVGLLCSILIGQHYLNNHPPNKHTTRPPSQQPFNLIG